MSNFGTFDTQKIHLERVDIINAQINNPLEIATKEVKDFKFRIGTNLGLYLGEKLVKTVLEVELATDIEGVEQQATGTFKLAYLFKVDNFDELVHIQREDKSVEVSDPLALHLTAISYSTTRGILLTRFQGTIFRDFILPIMSPAEILQQPVSA